MAIPQDKIAPADLKAGDFFLGENGRTYIRVPSGGHGGGATSYATVEATDEQHARHLRTLADAKAAEVDSLEEQHKAATENLDEQSAAQDEAALESGSEPSPKAPASPAKPSPHGVV